MKNAVIFGLAGALLTGILIGIQASLTNRTGQMIGPLKTGLLTNIMGGSMALLVLLVAVGGRWIGLEIPPRQALVMLFSAGALGILIIMGVSFSLRYTGVMAGLGTLIMGQMLVSTVVDATGWLGLERVPFTWQRAAGLLLLGVSILLLLPRK